MGGQWRKIFGTIDTSESINIFNKQKVFQLKKKWGKGSEFPMEQVVSQNMGKHLNFIINKCGKDIISCSPNCKD